MVNLFDKMTRFLAEFQDKRFETKYGIDTSSIILGPSLKTNSPFQANATAYMAVWYVNFKKLMQEARLHKQDFGTTHFIDIGCGMGKACFCASEFNFRKISGFDFDESLIHRAN